ncbi:hypothetical protein DPMN_149529 [Dreissena polymorpha]|uniref:EGF-like calcium-binding domain-containing protein n=1 Tax=Dreissena polymorpha TaxID=45954 RepID=A0A9D4J173_DREPO|nr:hypothetical protein DPMN_149529 [Dreissena polymorpha]
MRGLIRGDRCEDIDECGRFNGCCSHECYNNHGSYYCSCPEGFNMATNMHTCVGSNYLFLLIMASSLTLLALLCYLGKRFDWRVQASAAMRTLRHKFKRMWKEWRQHGKPTYEKIKKVNEDYKNDVCQNSDLRQPLIENQDIYM